MRRRSIAVVVPVSAGVLLAGLVVPSSVTARPAPAAVAHSAPHAVVAVAGRATDKVIVLMKDAAPLLGASTRSFARRSAAVASDTAPALAAVRASGATDIRTFHVLDGFAATMSRGQAAALQADPDVAEVLPDAVIHAPANALTPATQRAASSAGGRSPVDGVCDSDSATKAQLNPQATVLTHSDSDVPGAKTARSLGFTGAGVKVGLIAEGIDVDNPDFVRPDGSHVITDYRDFSGDGLHAPTDGAEMFLDATSVAAQGHKTYDVSHFSGLPLDRPCKIRIEGVAPGVQLAAMKIFSQDEVSLFSMALQGIDWAVGVDHVNVMNESYGYLPFPDSDMAALDQLNNQIIKAGVTVVASSGDSGITNAIWSGSSDPALISVGATTAYRFDLQTGYAFAAGSHATGYVDDNISSLSSGGVSQAGRSVDLVAPGELDFGSCTASSQYFGCLNYAGEPSDVEAISGTSQSGPVVAGAAALVIQAYRKTHGGADPSPALVKTLLTSTADDIDAPATQQGAGLLDSYKAVLAAESYPGGTAAARGQSLLAEPTHLYVPAKPGTRFTRHVTVTNDGAAKQTVDVASRTLGAYQQIARSTVTLSDSQSPHAIDFQGLPDNVERLRFFVPRGSDRLDTRIAWRGASAELPARVRMTLIDPRNRLAGYSLPQGIGNYGDSQVAHPVPGVWTAYITSRTTANGGSVGPVQFGAYAARWSTLGTVTPAQLTLAPGQSAPVTVHSTVPAVPGDTDYALVLTASAGTPSRVTTVPVVVRSRVHLTTKAQQFTDTITGPNGRGYASSVGRFFDMTVAKGTPEINVNVREAAAGNPFTALLVDPSGQAQASTSTDLVTRYGLHAVHAGQLHVLDPLPGVWRLIIDFGPTVSGTALGMAYTVRYDATPVTASAPGLPTDDATALPAGQAVTVPVTVHNAGSSSESVFLDARSDDPATYQAVQSTPTVAVPNPTGVASTIVVPTRTTSMTTTATSSVPVSFDVSWASGDPDYLATTRGTTATSTVDSTPISPGLWIVEPNGVGPYGSAATPAQAGLRTTIRTAAFDPAVTSATGDFWRSSIDPGATVRPVVVPGHGSVTIPVTITPDAVHNTVVRGAIYVDQLTSVGTVYGPGLYYPSGNETVALPYAYTVK